MSIFTDWLNVLTTDSMLARVINGKRALTTMNYTEVDVKTGRQRVAQLKTTITSGATVSIGFVTGAEPVIIKSRIINQIGSTEIDYSAYENRTFTGGTTVNVVNPNRVTQVASNVTIKSAVTPDAGGTLYLEPFPIFAAGNNAASRIGGDVAGMEYHLKANTSHVFQISNPGTGAATVHWWITFFEGSSDLPSGEIE